MTMSEAVSTGALVLIGVILTVLLMQYLKLRQLWQLALACRHNARWARIREMENRELRSARRADQAHIAQLQRKLVLLQDLVVAKE